MRRRTQPLCITSEGYQACSLECTAFSGCRWEKLGPSVIEKGYRIGCSSDFWNRYEEDIGIAKDLGEHIPSRPATRRLQPTAARTCSDLLVISIPHAGWFLHNRLQTPVIDLKSPPRDARQVRHAGCNSFRLSLEWSRIFPQRGVIDQSAVDRHHQIFDALDRYGCQPACCRATQQ